MLAAATAFGNETDAVADDGSHHLDDRDGFLGNQKIEKLIGDVRAMPFPLVEAPEFIQGSCIAGCCIPFQRIDSSLSSISGGSRPARFDTLNEMP